MADVKISELTAAGSATSDDLVVIVDDPAGTPSTMKLTIAELAAAVSGDKLPLAGGTMTGAILFGAGGQNINVGSFDNSTGGSSGISLVCAVGYELNWQGGHLSSSTSAGVTNYDITCDSSLTLAAGKRITFSDGTYLASKLPVITEAGTSYGVLSTDASVSDVVRVIYADNGSVENPTNPVDGKTIRWMLTQDGTGGRVIALDTKFHLPTSHVGALPFSTTANATDLLAATYCASRDQWDVIAFVMGY